MSQNTVVQYYSPKEERINVWTHFAGFVLSLVALGLLIFRGFQLEHLRAGISFAVFGISMSVLYLASTLYHRANTDRLRYRLKIFDHAAIYVLIAGTYTPFALVSMHGNGGGLIFGTVWGIAALGIFLKLFYTGRFKLFSTLLYVAMGWLIVFSFDSLKAGLAPEGVQWLLAGGVAYTVGAILYSIKKIPFNHAIFHIFVLAGTICHFISVYFYVIPLS